MRPSALTRLGIVALLLAPAARTGAQDAEAELQAPPYWVATQVAQAGGALEPVDETLVEEALRKFDDLDEIYEPSAVRSTTGRAFAALGRIPDWASILGSYAGGDKVGMANHATNAWLSSLVTGAGVTLGTALAATAGAPLLVGGVVGAFGAAVVYNNTAKVGVDAAFENMANAQIRLPDQTNRVRQARVWVAQANSACQQAGHRLDQARAGLTEVAAAEASAEWADDLLATARVQLGPVEESCGRLEASADPDALTTQLGARLSELDALVGQASSYADQVCRIESQMSQNSQPDAARIWNNEAQHLAGRARSTAAEARSKAETIGQQASLLAELDGLRAAAGSQAGAAKAHLNETATHLRGAADRIALAAPVLTRSQGALDEIRTAAETCDQQKTKAARILATCADQPSVQMVLTQEVDLIDPPFAALAELASGLEAGLRTVETARSRVLQASTEIEAWQARLDRCLTRSAAAAAVPPAGLEGRLSRLGQVEARSDQCAQEADTLALGPGGWGVGQVDEGNGSPEGWGAGQVSETDAASGGWGHGSTRDIVDTASLVDAAVAAVDHCNYIMAVTYIDEVLRKEPSNAWAHQSRPEVAAWVSKARTSSAALGQAKAELTGGDVQRAFLSLATARSNASPCDRDSIDAVWQRVREEAQRQEAAARAQAEQERQAAAWESQERERRNREAMAGLASSLGDLISALSQAQRRGSGPQPSVASGRRGGSPTSGNHGTGSTARTCSIVHQAQGNDGHFVIEFPPNQANAPTGYVVASVAGTVKVGRQTVCSTARSCLEHVIPYRDSGGRVVSEHSTLAAANADARKRCPNPVYSQ